MPSVGSVPRARGTGGSGARPGHGCLRPQRLDLGGDLRCWRSAGVASLLVSGTFSDARLLRPTVRVGSCVAAAEIPQQTHRLGRAHVRALAQGANRLIKCATYSCCEVAGIILSGLVAIWLAYTGRELAGGVRDSAGCGACNPEALWP